MVSNVFLNRFLVLCNIDTSRLRTPNPELNTKTKKKFLLNTYGYTLVELLVVIAVIGIITAPVSSFFIANYTTFFKESSKVDVQQVARAGMDVIITNMRKADQDSIQVISSTRLQMTIQEKTYEYYLNGTNVLQGEAGGGAASNQLMYNVTDFRVEKDGELVTVSVTASISGKNGHTLTLTKSHKIRT